MSNRTEVTLRGALVIDQMQPQFAASLAASSDGYFPVPGESAFWLEIEPGIAVNRLLDVALKSCDVKPGALLAERRFGTLEVHGGDQGQVREAGRRILSAANLAASDAPAPEILTSETIRQVDAHHAALVNRSRTGMLVLSEDTLYTLEVTPAIWALLAANEAEKAAPIRLVDLENSGAVGRLRFAGDDASIDMAVAAVQRTLDDAARPQLT